MTELFNPVVRDNRPPSELAYHEALVTGLARTAAKIGRGNLADKSNRTPRALDKLFSGSNMDTSGYGLLNFLLADPSALDEVFALYGFKLAPLHAEHGRDFATIADSAQLIATFTDALRDGRRDHRETLAIADKARAVVPHLSAIIAEADGIRGVGR